MHGRWSMAVKKTANKKTSYFYENILIALVIMMILVIMASFWRVTGLSKFCKKINFSTYKYVFISSWWLGNKYMRLIHSTYPNKKQGIVMNDLLQLIAIVIASVGAAALILALSKTVIITLPVILMQAATRNSVSSAPYRQRSRDQNNAGSCPFC